ncbi:hypothetical protein LRAMOSA05784 [Lichtheimia ramosa]|uniref:Zn(2)-C6 fungal-type domain-containing protein n=1 Tax=Lichtheimia ramosa TaxID=688394 RepID=A0A077X2Y9_9FUNG|nr:hypothetical protein LRAMOSA05784 [Lichtheimia ramosa]
MNVTMPMDKTRRKRLKVVSACGECRRKKTKCNGESPCIGCIKAKVECKYITSHKARAMARQAPASTSSTISSGSNNSNNHSYNISGMNQSSSNNSHNKPTVEAIEERLGVIEDILRALLKQGQENGGTPPPPATTSSYSLPVFDSSASCGSYPLPPSTTMGGVHASHVQNWHFARDPITPTPRRPNGGSAFHLPPLTSSSSISSACSLSSSSSTSTTSSASSSSGGPAIRNLLNDQDIDLPTPPPTASFHKEGHAYYRYHYQSENNL